MIEGLQPYAEYKESGQQWLGRIPRSWKVLPLCRVASPKSECGRPDLELLSVYLRRGVIRYSESGGQVHKPSLDLSNYQVVAPGDFVLNNQQAWRGSIGVSRYEGIISPAYLIMRLAPSLNPSYANLMFRSSAMVAQYVVASRGVGDIQRNLYYPDLRGSLVPVPPPDEQEAIVQFLGHANRKIDGLIRVKRKLTALLGEQKQAVIHRAVTRGPNPNAPLKPSDIPWLGDIPKHWEVRRAKYLFREIDERSKTGKETHLAMSQRLGLVPSDMVESSLRSESYAGAKLCKEGDLVLNRLKAHLGVFALAKQGGVISPDYSVFRKRAAINMTYFESVLRSSACRRELRIRAKGIVEGFWRLYTDDFYDIRLPVPPIDEQTTIMSAIATSTKDLNTAIARTEHEIALMQEYRTRLTADVVTGKLDVRSAAHLLVPPDDATPDPATDELLEETEA